MNKPKTDAPKKKRGGRPRGNCVDVYLAPEEKAVIAQRAARSDKSYSGMLRALGLNTPIPSILDSDVIAELVRVGAEVNQAGSQLKEWLAADGKDSAPEINPEALLREMQALAEQMRVLMAKAVRDR
ncbi:plasmid mobilization protein [Kerstersia gyiorum]|uniref:plasmid mobilization protein n=1 Tax=Kerstersia gyiorum TaxID=206506 RepID=UPI003B430489